MFRHFVNILVDNPPRYPRLTHRFDLTYTREVVPTDVENYMCVVPALLVQK